MVSASPTILLVPSACLEFTTEILGIESTATVFIIKIYVVDLYYLDLNFKLDCPE